LLAGNRGRLLGHAVRSFYVWQIHSAPFFALRFGMPRRSRRVINVTVKIWGFRAISA